MLVLRLVVVTSSFMRRHRRAFGVTFILAIEISSKESQVQLTIPITSEIHIRHTISSQENSSWISFLHI